MYRNREAYWLTTWNIQSSITNDNKLIWNEYAAFYELPKYIEQYLLVLLDVAANYMKIIFDCVLLYADFPYFFWHLICLEEK